MQYNPAAPPYMHSYWGLEDNKPELKRVASRVMLYYICGTGKYIDQMEALEEACFFAGFKTIIAHSVGFNMGSSEADLFEDFRDEINSISRGKYENEVLQVANIIEKYQPLTKKVHCCNAPVDAACS